MKGHVARPWLSCTCFGQAFLGMLRMTHPLKCGGQDPTVSEVFPKTLQLLDMVESWLKQTR